MAIKHILLPLNGESENAHVAIYALQLAERLGAHVTAGYGNDFMFGFMMPVDYGSAAAYAALYETMQKLEAERRAKARAYFDQAVAAVKLPIVSAPVCKQGSTMWLDGENPPFLSSGIVADLVIIGAPGASDTPTAWNLADDALFRMRRPVLVVPHNAVSTDFSKAAVAWNGSAEAAAALQYSVDLLHPAARVSVLQVGELPDTARNARFAIDYLGWHCFDAEIRDVPDQPKATAKLLCDEAKAAGADCLIMGAFTHSRVRELLLGGVTNHMLRHATLPLIMAH